MKGIYCLNRAIRSSPFPEEDQIMAKTPDHEHPHEHPHGHPDYEEHFKKMEERIESLEETVHRLSHNLLEHTEHGHPKAA
jgi:hypothetical protein